MSKLTGGKVNYYLVQVEHPQREEQPPYQAECEDIAEALQLTPNEFCEFKAIWRTAAARLGNGKPGQQALYDAEKRVHYATRDLKKLRREVESIELTRLNAEIREASPEGWIAHEGHEMPRGLNPNQVIEVRLDNGYIPVAQHKAGYWVWDRKEGVNSIAAWRIPE